MATETGRQDAGRTSSRSLPYLPWMDGMRAIAVLAVMVSHVALVQGDLGIDKWMNGGFLGVDVFFAISGFLITTLLLQEAAKLGGIRFGAFYLRRARRLLPALAALLAFVTVIAVVGEHGHHRVVTLGHVAITVLYAGNWFMAYKHVIEPLGQTWSLAIEEQFYFLWPAVIAGVLLLTRHRPKRTFAAVAGITVLSIGWLEFAAHRQWNYGNRIFYGTDTRGASLACGAVLGAAYVAGVLPTGRVAVLVRRVLAVLGVVVIVWLFHNPAGPVEFVTHHHWTHLGTYSVDSIFWFVALSTSFVVWELVASAPHLGHRILAWTPLVAIGRISYALYLWDGTFTVWITRDLVGFGGWWLVVVRTIASFAAAILSWFFVEKWFRKRRPGPAPAGSTVPGG